MKLTEQVVRNISSRLTVIESECVALRPFRRRHWFVFFASAHAHHQISAHKKVCIEIYCSMNHLRFHKKVWCFYVSQETWSVGFQLDRTHKVFPWWLCRQPTARLSRKFSLFSFFLNLLRKNFEHRIEAWKIEDNRAAWRDPETTRVVESAKSSNHSRTSTSILTTFGYWFN